MSTKKRKRRAQGQPAQQRRQGQGGQPPREGSGQRRPPPIEYQQYRASARPAAGGESQRRAQPRRTDNTVAFPTGQTRPSARPGRPDGRQGGARGQSPRPARQQPAGARSLPRQEARRRRVTRKMLRRRRMMRRLAAVLLVLCVAAIGIYLTVTMLFKINAIRVAGPDGVTVAEAGPYTSEEILEVLGVQLEENIFSFDPGSKAEELEKAFPLLEQIEVRRVYPSTVVVRVTPAQPAYAMETPAGWLSLSAGLKILAFDTARPELPVLYGGDPVSTTPGDQLAYARPAAQEPDSAAGSAASGGSAAQTAEADGRLDALNTLLAALEARGLLAGVTRIEYADVEQIAFLYQDRISVLLGTLNELDYKLDYAEYMLLNRDGRGCAETDTGQLDCSHVRTDGSLQAIFAQGVPELPSGYLVPDEPAEAEPAPGEADADAEHTADSGDNAGAGAGEDGEAAEADAGADAAQTSEEE